jgi:formate dehydrogenase maturation protein FdhE
VSRLARPSTPPASAELERRAARAQHLAGEAPKAGEPLRFAAGLYAVQARAANALEAAHAKQPLSGRLSDDCERFEDEARAILRYVSDSAPAPLAEAASSRRNDSAPTARARLLLYWTEDRPDDGDYLSRAVLRPYVETLRRWNVAPDRVHRSGHCPFCGGSPWVGLRRDGAEMEGARRFLVCALCGGEWSFSRILCPSCFEQDPYKLPSFGSEAHEAVRIEACETCRQYVKSIDLSGDARPIPEVDDLVSLSMDLWAADQGFTRIEPGLAGL